MRAQYTVVTLRISDGTFCARSQLWLPWMFKHYWKYEWVLPVYRYEGIEPLLAALAEKVIAPAEGKVKLLAERRMIEAELTKPQ